MSVGLPNLADEVLPLNASVNPRVHVVHSSHGTVAIVGVTISGEWVAEYRCKIARFRPACIRRMEQEVLDEERRMGIAAPKSESRVLPFPST